MVMTSRKSIRLKESSAEKETSADREAEQDLDRPSHHPWDYNTRQLIGQEKPKSGVLGESVMFEPSFWEEGTEEAAAQGLRPRTCPKRF